MLGEIEVQNKKLNLAIKCVRGETKIGCGQTTVEEESKFQVEAPH